MNIFSEIKEYLTAKQAAENYGLQVRRNGTACCPFHDDKHPSMKIDINYHCFACGVGGDVIDYVSRMFGLSQYGAARKLIDDFSLNVGIAPEKIIETFIQCIPYTGFPKVLNAIFVAKKIFAERGITFAK